MSTPCHKSCKRYWFIVGLAAMLVGGVSVADEPPAINPFGNRPRVREDSVPGYIEMSDGTVYPGHIYLTRDMRLKIYDGKLKRQREVPLDKIKAIECEVDREWMEKEWRFRENANDQKVYTGRQYPARVYLHTIVLKDGRKIRGPMSGIIYVQQEGKAARRFLLHKRQKGSVGQKLKSLVYVRSVQLGPEAFKRGTKLALEQAGDRPKH